MVQQLKRYGFLFAELVKRDFKTKYKGTVLGMAWSVLSPLLQLLIMRLVFTHFFGTTIAHYTTFLFCGNIVYNYFSEATSQGMVSLVANAGIFTKVNVPKYMFLLARDTQTLLNFALTLIVFVALVMLDGIFPTWRWLYLIYPIIMLILFNLGFGLVLSALYVFFRDMQYLWAIFTQLLMYLSAIFYDISSFPLKSQKLFMLNPVYLFIRYFRMIVIDASVPDWRLHALIALDTAVLLALGAGMYKKYNTDFLYYV